MTELAATVDLGIERLVHLDQRIDANESDALRTRWEFGCQMLDYVGENGQLPHRFLLGLAERTGKSRTELKYRRMFAERYPTESEVVNALTTFTAWREVAKSLKGEQDAEDAVAVDSEPQSVPVGEFSTFVADPPWHYGNTSTRNAAANHYGTMSIEELCALDIVPTHAADRSHLYLWTTSSHLPDAFAVMAAWGFEYKTYIVWVKPQIGMGNYFRVCTEMVLFGVRGGMRTNDRSLRNHFTAGRSKHSAKPTAFHDIVMKASPGPYLELFSRCHASEMLAGCTCSKCRLGWSTWGDQS